MTLRYVPETLGGEGSTLATWVKPRSARGNYAWGMDLVLRGRVQQWWPTIRSRHNQVRAKT